MADWGSTATTSEITDTTSRIGGGPFGAAAGTLTDVSFFAGGWAGTGERLRVAVYQGGSSTDPTGASLIYDSGELNCDGFTATGAWRSLVTDFSLSPSGSLAASTPTWFAIKVAADAFLGLNATNKGDLTYLDGGDSKNANGYTDFTNTSVAFPSTFPTYSNTGGAEQLMAKLTFVEAADVEQEGFRFGEDDGSESAHTWTAAQDTNVTAALGVAKLIRILLATDDDPGANPYTLRFQKNGTGGYSPVPVGASTSVTLSWGAAGTIAYSTSGGASVAPTYPSGITVNSALVLVVGQKPGTANGGTVTTPSGWTLRGSTLAKGGYSTTLAGDTGNTNLLIYTKDTVSGSESGTLSVTLSDNGVAWANIYRVQASNTCTWSFAEAGDAEDTSAGNVSLAFASDPGVTAGDFILAGMCIPTDITTPSQFSVHDITQAGIGFGAVAEIQEPDSSVGNDIGGYMIYAPVNSGTSSGAPTITATAGGTTTNVRGPGIFLRVRATGAANQVYVDTSSNIAAGGEATTARLSAPTGKTTSDFTTGRRWDDENGTDTIDIASADYTELEWKINTQSPAVSGDYFDFRVYNGASALTTYTVTPRLTLGGDVTASPTGVAGTGQVGTITESHTSAVTPTGVAGTGQVGTLTATAGTSASPTGVAGTGEVGTLTGKSDATSVLTGVVGTGQVGTLTASSAAAGTANVTGVSGTGSAGSLTGIHVEMTLTTLLATGGVGTLTVTGTANVVLAGVAGTGQIGTLSEIHASLLTLAGVQASGQVGALVSQVDVTLTGVSSAGSPGTVTTQGAAAASPSGVASTGQVGTLAASAGGSASALPAGVAATGQVGSLIEIHDGSLVLTGVEAATAVGSLSISGDALTLIVDVGATGQTGTLSASGSGSAVASPSGVQSSGQVGIITVRADALTALAGVATIGYAGFITFGPILPPKSRIGVADTRSRISRISFTSRTGRA